jgi:hypothetical protein
MGKGDIMKRGIRIKFFPSNYTGKKTSSSITGVHIKKKKFHLIPTNSFLTLKIRGTSGIR